MRALVLITLLFFHFGCTRATRPAQTAPASPKPLALCPSTSHEANLTLSLANIGAKIGDPVMLRIFKEEKKLELWIKPKGKRYLLAKTYPICRFSGKLGPKQREGDKQSPEGVYILSQKSCNPYSKYCKALDIGYPNRLDRHCGRTGCQIMIHGGCKSIGCFAMTDRRIEEIYTVVETALKRGQPYIYLFIYPFRMTPQNLKRYSHSPWFGFWTNLKEGYDYFQRTGRTPEVRVKGTKYIFR